MNRTDIRYPGHGSKTPSHFRAPQITGGAFQKCEVVLERTLIVWPVSMDEGELYD